MTALQKRIIAELNVQPTISPQEEVRKSVDFMKEYTRKHTFLNGFVLGISGGQDSTLVGKLAQIAVDELNSEDGTTRYQFIAVRLPYGSQFDEEDCEDALKFINPSKIYTVNIKEAVDASEHALLNEGVSLSDYAKGNEKARERMKVQYSIAAMHNCVVLGSDHAAESITGFFTKFGDGGADLMPISGLNKRQGKLLLQLLGCPEHLYMKVPTADLEEDRPALPDEEALGITYDQIDDYLEGKTIVEDARKKLEDYYFKAQHKRHMPITTFDTFWK
ncbi:ammonia-dependent NAD(+) synthetase [Sporosarcina sp. CAU 1771]